MELTLFNSFDYIIRHLGIIKSGDHVFHIYEVKGDTERNYLYWTWEWEGEMYIREDLLDIEN